MKKKVYKIKKTKKLIKKLKPYWKVLSVINNQHRKTIYKLEKQMEKATGIKGIEFFMSDLGEYAGIGNLSRTMELIHERELEEGKIIKYD